MYFELIIKTKNVDKVPLKRKILRAVYIYFGCVWKLARWSVYGVRDVISENPFNFNVSTMEV